MFRSSLDNGLMISRGLFRLTALHRLGLLSCINSCDAVTQVTRLVLPGCCIWAFFLQFLLLALWLCWAYWFRCCDVAPFIVEQWYRMRLRYPWHPNDRYSSYFWPISWLVVLPSLTSPDLEALSQQKYTVVYCCGGDRQNGVSDYFASSNHPAINNNHVARGRRRTLQQKASSPSPCKKWCMEKWFQVFFQL